MENAQRCKEAGIHKPEKIRFCVRDLCNGLPMKIEDRIIVKNKSEKKRKLLKLLKKLIELLVN